MENHKIFYCIFVLLSFSLYTKEKRKNNVDINNVGTSDKVHEASEASNESSKNEDNNAIDQAGDVLGEEDNREHYLKNNFKEEKVNNSDYINIVKKFYILFESIIADLKESHSMDDIINLMKATEQAFKNNYNISFQDIQIIFKNFAEDKNDVKYSFYDIKNIFSFFSTFLETVFKEKKYNLKEIIEKIDTSEALVTEINNFFVIYSDYFDNTKVVSDKKVTLFQKEMTKLISDTIKVMRNIIKNVTSGLYNKSGIINDWFFGKNEGKVLNLSKKNPVYNFQNSFLVPLFSSLNEELQELMLQIASLEDQLSEKKLCYLYNNTISVLMYSLGIINYCIKNNFLPVNSKFNINNEKVVEQQKKDLDLQVEKFIKKNNKNTALDLNVLKSKGFSFNLNTFSENITFCNSLIKKYNSMVFNLSLYKLQSVYRSFVNSFHYLKRWNKVSKDSFNFIFSSNFIPLLFSCEMYANFKGLPSLGIGNTIIHGFTKIWSFFYNGLRDQEGNKYEDSITSVEKAKFHVISEDLAKINELSRRIESRLGLNVRVTDMSVNSKTLKIGFQKKNSPSDWTEVNISGINSFSDDTDKNMENLKKEIGPKGVEFLQDLYKNFVSEGKYSSGLSYNNVMSSLRELISISDKTYKEIYEKYIEKFMFAEDSRLKRIAKKSDLEIETQINLACKNITNKDSIKTLKEKIGDGNIFSDEELRILLNYAAERKLYDEKYASQFEALNTLLENKGHDGVAQIAGTLPFGHIGLAAGCGLMAKKSLASVNSFGITSKISRFFEKLHYYLLGESLPKDNGDMDGEAVKSIDNKITLDNDCFQVFDDQGLLEWPRMIINMVESSLKGEPVDMNVRAKIPHSCLFTGPSGSGKTFTVNAFLNHLNKISRDDKGKSPISVVQLPIDPKIFSGVVSDGEVKKLDVLDELDTLLKRSLVDNTFYIVYFDEFHLFFSKDGHVNSERLADFLKFFNNLYEYQKDHKGLGGMYVICSTNKESLVPHEFFDNPSRLSSTFRFNFLDEEWGVRVLKKELEKNNVITSHIDWEYLKDVLRGVNLTHGNLVSVVNKVFIYSQFYNKIIDTELIYTTINDIIRKVITNYKYNKSDRFISSLAKYYSSCVALVSNYFASNRAEFDMATILPLRDELIPKSAERVYERPPHKDYEYGKVFYKKNDINHVVDKESIVFDILRLVGPIIYTDMYNIPKVNDAVISSLATIEDILYHYYAAKISNLSSAGRINREKKINDYAPEATILSYNDLYGDDNTKNVIKGTLEKAKILLESFYALDVVKSFIGIISKVLLEKGTITQKDINSAVDGNIIKEIKTQFDALFKKLIEIV